jgi:hypothetical protein
MATYPTIFMDFPFEELTPDYGVIRTAFEDGTVQTRAKRTTSGRQYHFFHRNMTSAEYTTLRDFWIAQKGGALAFDFVDPRNGATVSCRFLMDRTTFTRTGPLTFDAEVTLEEVL